MAVLATNWESFQPSPAEREKNYPLTSVISVKRNITRMDGALIPMRANIEHSALNRQGNQQPETGEHQSLALNASIDSARAD